MGRGHPLRAPIYLLAGALWALALIQAAGPVEPAVASVNPSNEPVAPAITIDGPKPPPVETVSTETPTSTKPLRWRVLSAVHNTDASLNAISGICVTVVSVRNLGPNGDTLVEVEFFNHNGTSEGLGGRFVPPGDRRVFYTAPDVSPGPFSAWVDSPDFALIDTGSFVGFANVNATDPRIYADAHIVCRDGTGSGTNITGLTQVAAAPVGATLDFFQAGIADPESSARIIDR